MVSTALFGKNGIYFRQRFTILKEESGYFCTHFIKNRKIYSLYYYFNMAVKFYKEENQVPLEMHKVRMVQKLSLLPVEERLRKIQDAGNNTFLLQNRDIYLDMLTDSGVNGMTDLQFAASMRADDAYAGSETFNRVKAAVKEVFGTSYVLPAHQGRACENILAEA